MKGNPLKCQEVQVQLDAWLCNEIAPIGAEQIKRHLDSCKRCSKLLDDQQILRTQVLQAGANIPPETNAQMFALLGDLASQQRKRAQVQSTVRRKEKSKTLLLIALSSALVGFFALYTISLPLAIRLALAGCILNLCGLLLILPALKNYREWNQG